MTQIYQGSCHCQAVRYTAQLDLDQPVIECNCSHCQRAGLLLQFISEDQFRLMSGDDVFTEYRFNTNRIAHQFCSICGIECFAKGEKDGKPTYAINVRTVEGIDLRTLTRKAVNGKDF